MKLSELLRDLDKQATKDRSHFYVGRLARDAADALDECELTLAKVIELAEQVGADMPNVERLHRTLTYHRETDL